MKNNLDEISNSIIGYNKEDVSQYLEHLNSEHNQKIDILQKLIEFYKKQKQDLHDEIIELKSKKNDLDEDEIYMKIALERSEKASKLLEEYTLKHEIPEMVDKYNKEIDSIKRKISLIQSKNEDIRKNADKFVSDLNRLILNLDESIQKRNNIIKFSDMFTKKQNEKNSNQPTDYDMNESKRKDVKQTADGTILPDNKSNTNSDISENSELARIIKSFTMGTNTKHEEPLKPIEEIKGIKETKEIKPKNNNLNIFNVIEKKIEEKTDYKIIDNRSTSNNAIPEKAKVIEDNFWGEIPSNDFENTINDNSIKLDILAQNEKSSKESIYANTTTDINSIRDNYIVGKKAGETLSSSNGSIIINKGEIITKQIIERVDSEGKLPDLIINMILPDMEV